MTGYGDITGTTTYERLFCIFIFLAGGFTFAYTIGLAAGYISEMNISKTEYREKIDRIRQYCEAKGVKTDLQKQIIGFFRKKVKNMILCVFFHYIYIYIEREREREREIKSSYRKLLGRESCLYSIPEALSLTRILY